MMQLEGESQSRSMFTSRGLAPMSVRREWTREKSYFWQPSAEEQLSTGSDWVSRWNRPVLSLSFSLASVVAFNSEININRRYSRSCCLLRRNAPVCYPLLSWRLATLTFIPNHSSLIRRSTCTASQTQIVASRPVSRCLLAASTISTTSTITSSSSRIVGCHHLHQLAEGIIVGASSFTALQPTANSSSSGSSQERSSQSGSSASQGLLYCSLVYPTKLLASVSAPMPRTTATTVTVTSPYTHTLTHTLVADDLTLR